MHYANDAKTFLKHFSDYLFYFCSTCADCLTTTLHGDAMGELINPLSHTCCAWGKKAPTSLSRRTTNLFVSNCIRGFSTMASSRKVIARTTDNRKYFFLWNYDR